MVAFIQTFTELLDFLRLDLSTGNILLVLGIIIAALGAIVLYMIRKGAYWKPFKGKDALRKRNEGLKELLNSTEEKMRDISLKMMRDAEQQKLVESSYKTQNQQLRDFSVRLEKAREEERARIAREIHDELGQQLTAIKIDISWIKKRINPEESELQERIKGLISLVDQTVITVRKIATDLRPGILDDLGLIPALEWQCAEFSKRSGIECNFNCKIGDLEFDDDFSTTVFRIFQETLTNIAKHSGASKVEIKIFMNEDGLNLEVKDNGAGITEEEARSNNSLGLLGMRERALLYGGKIFINGNQKEGTVVKLLMPLPSMGKNAVSEYV
jgi:signal transduction histidine kinase